MPKRVTPRTQSVIKDRLEIGQKIRAAREAAGYTQAQMGAMIGTTQSIIGQYERGEMEPGAVRIREIARALEIPAGQLIE